MGIENDFFTKKKPSFESVLYWKDKPDKASDLNEMVKRFRVVFDNDRDMFYQYDYEFLARSISLLRYYKNYESFEDVYYLYVEFSIDEADLWLGITEDYLSEGVSEKNLEFLLREWSDLYDEFGFSEYVVIKTLEMIISLGHYSQELDELIGELIHEGEPAFLGSLIMNLANFPKAKNELKKRLKYIAPMIKYVGGNRFNNYYFNDWIEFAEAYLLLFKSIEIDKVYDKVKIFKNEDDEFLSDCLTGQDERIKKLNKKYFTKQIKQVVDEKSFAAIAVREKLMKEEFLDTLPETYQEWISSPFLDPLQKEEMMSFMKESVEDQMILEKPLRKIGRNDPCPCESGKKYKKCCLV